MWSCVGSVPQHLLFEDLVSALPAEMLAAYAATWIALKAKVIRQLYTSMRTTRSNASHLLV